MISAARLITSFALSVAVFTAPTAGYAQSSETEDLEFMWRAECSLTANSGEKFTVQYGWLVVDGVIGKKSMLTIPKGTKLPAGNHMFKQLLLPLEIRPPERPSLQTVYQHTLNGLGEASQFGGNETFWLWETGAEGVAAGTIKLHGLINIPQDDESGEKKNPFNDWYNLNCEIPGKEEETDK